VKRRFQIAVATPRSSSDQSEAAFRFGRFGRLKAIAAAVLLSATLIAVLIVAVVLGYVFAVVLCIIVIIAIASFLVKLSFQRIRQ